ncbi:MAG: tyrosine-type recombinase/integrase [Ardenticatenaceae bacterium]|nr:tyrosine-type recombinase/integrase [Ardenticatenaceae bacterium]
MLAEIARFQQWLRRRSPHASTHIHYANDVELFFNWCDKAVAEVSATDIDAFIEQCQVQGHATATVNRRLAALRTFYRFLDLTMADAPRNPVLPQRHYIRQGRRLPRDVEDEVLEALFAVIQSPRDKAMFSLMLRCGLRVGEVRSLNMNDLYLQPASGQLPRLWLHGKGGNERVAYLSPQALVVLQAWLAVRPVSGGSPAVFLNRFGRRLTVTGIQYILAGYCREAGVWVTCHQFRHTFARHLVEAGVPVTTIQRLLGHVRIRTTEVYLHISDTQTQADYQAAMAVLAERLAGGG